MANVSYMLMRQRQKMYIKAYAVLCLIIAVAMGFYSYDKWQQYTAYKQIVDKNKTFISELRDEVSDEKGLYEADKSGFDSLNKEIEEKLALIFPITDNYTVLTRQIDEFEQELNKKNDPFHISSITYQDPLVMGLYSVLPMKMDIESSRENFSKFLHIVENSGSLNDQLRLMDISSIRLNFQEAEVEGPEIITFSVQINAYFQ